MLVAKRLEADGQLDRDCGITSSLSSSIRDLTNDLKNLYSTR